MIDMLTAWAKSNTLPYDFRRACANDVLDRILGKPVQMQANAGEDAYRQHMEQVRVALYGPGESKTGPAASPEASQPAGNRV